MTPWLFQPSLINFLGFFANSQAGWSGLAAEQQDALIIDSWAVWFCLAVDQSAFPSPNDQVDPVHAVAILRRPRFGLEAAARWARMRSSRTLAGSSLGSCGTSFAGNARFQSVEQHANAGGRNIVTFSTPPLGTG